MSASGTPTFNDDFDGSSIDPTRWNTDVATSGNRWCPVQPENRADSSAGTWIDISVDACYGLMVSPPYASITVGGGLASFAAPDGRSFAYVVAGPPTRQPFPTSGNFVLELRVRYDLANTAGDGVMVLATQNADPAGTNSPDQSDTRVFQIWDDGGGLVADVLGGNVVSIPSASAFHDYRLEYAGGAYSLFVDGSQVLGPIASALRPSTIWLGNPVALWWGGGSFGPWTAFTIDSIRVVANTNDHPVNTAPPSIILPRGAVDGSRLYSSLGTWTNATSYALTWLRCGGQGCSAVGHDTTYLLGAADIARRMQLRVTAFNGNGSTDATSELTNPVQAAPPLALHLPLISGTFALGSTLTASTGSWSGTSPLSYLFEWFRCSSAGPCKAIAAATGSSYVVQSADLGNRLRARVRAWNSAGDAWAASATLPASSNVAPPRNTSLPQLSGTPIVGSTMQAGTGAWSGTPTIAFSYQWRRCSALAATSCTAIVGASDNHYVVTVGDQGMRLRVIVTAVNSVLRNRATSLASPVVT